MAGKEHTISAESFARKGMISVRQVAKAVRLGRVLRCDWARELGLMTSGSGRVVLGGVLQSSEQATERPGPRHEHLISGPAKPQHIVPPARTPACSRSSKRRWCLHCLTKQHTAPHSTPHLMRRTARCTHAHKRPFPTFAAEPRAQNKPCRQALSPLLPCGEAAAQPSSSAGSFSTLIMSSMRSTVSAASVANWMIFTLFIVGSSTPASTLSRSSPFTRSRPHCTRRNALSGRPTLDAGVGKRVHRHHHGATAEIANRGDGRQRNMANSGRWPTVGTQRHTCAR